MKAVWKVLIGAAAVAAVAPYKVEKDEESGKVKVTSATWSATYTKSPEGPNLTVNLLPMFAKSRGECSDEECCCCGEEDESGEGITIDVEVEESAEAGEAEKPESAEEPESVEEPESAEEPKPEEA